MKVVIDIPDNEYCTIKEMNLTLHTERLKGSMKDWENANAILNLLESVKSGVVLPKGHGDLIDRDETAKTWGDKYFYQGVPLENYIEEVPAVIPADEDGSDESSS